MGDQRDEPRVNAVEVIGGQVHELIAGTPTKVIDVVLDQFAHHWDAYEIRRQRPHLSLAQIYAALAYYHDHQLELDLLALT